MACRIYTCSVFFIALIAKPYLNLLQEIFTGKAFDAVLIHQQLIILSTS